jgi:hypothetical protein
MPPADHQPVDPNSGNADPAEVVLPDVESEVESVPTETGEPEPVSQQELNAWRRGFTPQAEIWNGRLAMLGLSVGLAVLVIARLASSLNHP